jgi:hypothetical protein
MAGFITASLDGGLTWVTDPTPPAGVGPLVAAAQLGSDVVISGNVDFTGDPYLAYSTDGGGTFTPAATEPATIDVADTLHALTS